MPARYVNGTDSVAAHAEMNLDHMYRPRMKDHTLECFRGMPPRQHSRLELGFDLPLDIQGTAFQKRVWKALQQIPPGTTATYTEIATKIGMPTAVRAVAQACGANSLAIAIPCHRIIRNDGSLSGYRWGVERKRALLEREAQA